MVERIFSEREKRRERFCIFIIMNTEERLILHFNKTKGKREGKREREWRGKGGRGK
jgi:hypothetical protein